jgi:hypothetical protein
MKEFWIKRCGNHVHGVGSAESKFADVRAALVLAVRKHPLPIAAEV